MESKLLDSGIQNYSANFARKICDAFFRESKTISGPQILELTPIDQVNLFAMRTLYRDWTQQRKHLTSPFFNFQDPQVQQVQQALDQLLNLLSRKIHVDRENFEAVLGQAVSDTIRLVFSPYDFYLKNLNAQSPGLISAKTLEEDLKYIKVNHGILKRAVDLIQYEATKELTKEDLDGIFDRILKDTEELPDDFAPFLHQFTEIEPLSLDLIYSETKTDEPASVNEKYSSSQETLNDQLNVDQSSTVASAHEARKIDNILGNISVNQRYMFVNELFSGDTGQFTEAFEGLEKYNSYQEALDALRDSYAGTHNWDLDSTSYRELLDILNKRYN